MMQMCLVITYKRSLSMG